MYFFLIGLMLSYFYSKFILPSNTGNKPFISPTIYPILYQGMMIIPFNKDKAVHVHHWLIYLFIFIIGLILELPKIIIGFCLGLFIQGLNYDDKFSFIKKNPYNKA